MDTTSSLATFRKKYQLSRENLLGTLVNRQGEPISERTLRDLLASKSRPCETMIQKNAQNLASLVVQLHPTRPHQEVLQESLEVLWALREPALESGGRMAESSSLECARTEPRGDDPSYLSRGRKLSDGLEAIYTEYETALCPERIQPAYRPEQMEPGDFIDWAHRNSEELLAAYEAERCTQGGKNLLFHLLHWTELACSRLHRSLASLVKIEKRWRQALKEALRALPAMEGKRERRTWLEFHRLRSNIALAEDWLVEHDRNIRPLQKQLERAEQASLRWIDLFEEVEGERMFMVFDRLHRSFEIRMAIHKRWVKVVGDGHRWPDTCDPFDGFVACDSPLWPKLASDPDAVSFGLAEALDILLMPAEMKRQLFCVPVAPDPSREPGKARRADQSSKKSKP